MTQSLQTKVKFNFIKTHDGDNLAVGALPTSGDILSLVNGNK